MALGSRLPAYDMDTPELSLLDSTISGDYVYILTRTHIHKFKANDVLARGEEIPVSEDTDFASTPAKITSDNTHLYIGYSGATTGNVTVAELEKRPLSDITKATWKRRLESQAGNWTRFYSNSQLAQMRIKAMAASPTASYIVILWVTDVRRRSQLFLNALYSKDTGGQYRDGGLLAEFNSRRVAATFDETNGSKVLTAIGNRTRPEQSYQRITWRPYTNTLGMTSRGESNINSITNSTVPILSFLRENFQGMMTKGGVSWLSVPGDGDTWKLVAFQSGILSADPPFVPFEHKANRFDRESMYDVTYDDLGDQRNLIQDITISEGLAWILTSQTAAPHLFRRALNKDPDYAKTILLTKGIGPAWRITRDAKHLYIGYSEFQEGTTIVMTQRVEQRLIIDPETVTNTWTLELSATGQWRTTAPQLSPFPFQGLASPQLGTPADKVWVSGFIFLTRQEVANVGIKKQDGTQDTSVAPAILERPWSHALGHDIDDDVYYLPYYLSNAKDIVYRDFTDQAGSFGEWLLATETHPANTGVPAMSHASRGFGAWKGYGWWAEATETEVKLVCFLLGMGEPASPIVAPPALPPPPPPPEPPAPAAKPVPVVPREIPPLPSSSRFSVGAVDSKQD